MLDFKSFIQDTTPKAFLEDASQKDKLNTYKVVLKNIWSKAERIIFQDAKDSNDLLSIIQKQYGRCMEVVSFFMVTSGG